MPELNFNALIPRQDFFQGYSEGQQQQNLLAQQAQARQLGDIQIKNAMREQQNAEAEAEAVKGASTLEEMAKRYRAAGLGKQALATEAAISKQKTDRLAQAKTQHELIKGAANQVFANPEAAQQILMNFSRQTGIDVADDLAQIESLGGDPAKVKQWASGIAIEADKLTPKFHSLTIPGKGVQTGTTDISGNFTPGTLFKEEMSQAQIESNNIAKQRLAFEQGKFAWEKANPGYELKEDADGNFFGVNKRTLQAVPVTVGGGAPASAPAVSGAGMPGPRVAQPGVVPAILGMTSVLDQAAPAAAPATGVRQLTGKGTALTESQGNAVAYGMRAKEANAILDELSKKGVLRGANIESTPFIGESLGKVLPSVLGGTSGAQQQVNQAKLNFITAVLRKESGASIPPSEYETEDKKYFPQMNDSAATIKQKENARKIAIQALGYQAGPGVKHINEFKPSVGGIAGASDNDPLGLLGGKP